MTGDCCECCKEQFVFNDFGVGPHTGSYWPTFRGTAQGNFSVGAAAGETLIGIPHPPWCCVRPSIVHLNAYATAPNEGTLRVFIESTRDFATNIWAELQTRSYTFIPFVLCEHDHAGNVPSLVPFAQRKASTTYTPAFGMASPETIEPPAGSTWSPIFSVPQFVFRNAEDDDAYFLSQWPVINPKSLNDDDSQLPIEFHACALAIQFGQRQATTESMLERFRSFFNLHTAAVLNDFIAPGTTVSIRLGSFVDERLHVKETIPCGIYVAYGHDHEQSWSWPFTVPRTVITSTEQIETPRFIGMQQTATRSIAPGGAQHNPIVPTELFAYTACEANSAAVLPAIDEQNNLSVPVVAWVPQPPAENSEITAGDPYYARRTDRVLNVVHNVPNGNSWHASHIVREGSGLASAGAVQQLQLTLLPHESGKPDVTPTFFIGVYSGSVSDAGLRLRLLDNDPFPWNAIADTPYLFDTQINSEQLFPNQWHYWSEQPQCVFDYDIENPLAGDLFEPQPPMASSDVTMPNLSVLNGTVYRVDDYRAAFKYETAVQAFAFTTLAAVPHVNPLGISLADSGMASHDWDRIRHDGAYTATPQVTLHCVFRIREKWTVKEVRGYAREWEISTQNDVTAFYQTGNVVVVAQVDGTDVAITEKQLSFSVDITQHIDALGEGESIDVPLVLNDTHMRTIRIQLAA